MFKEVFLKHWLDWTIAIIVMVFILLMGAIQRYSIEQDYSFTSDEIFYSIKFRARHLQQNPDWKTYRNEKYGFEFKYPNDFPFGESFSYVNTELTLLGPRGIGESLAFAFVLTENGTHFLFPFPYSLKNNANAPPKNLEDLRRIFQSRNNTRNEESSVIMRIRISDIVTSYGQKRLRVEVKNESTPEGPGSVRTNYYFL